jgi:gas vesicle protein
MSDERSNAGTNLILFLVGVAAGALLVALTTPKSGPELRQDILEKAARLKRKAREVGSALCPVCGQEEEPGHEDEEVGS